MSTMDKQEQDLDNLIFNDDKEQTQTQTQTQAKVETEATTAAPVDDAAKAAVRKASTSTDESEPRPQQGSSDEETETPSNTRRSSLKFDRASLVNVLPVDKIKNGASTASKMLGQGFSSFKEKTSAAYETAKSSQAGSAVASGLNRATTAGSEQITKLKETETYKKASSAASSQYEKTTTVASAAVGKAKSTASVGLEKAKSGASSGLETIKSKVGTGEKKASE